MKKNFDAAHSSFSQYEMTISYRKKDADMKPLARVLFIATRSLMMLFTDPGRQGGTKSAFLFILPLV
ncbi:hypothetical protein [Herbaspirillum sp. GW103]|uniref:hypothetical protein n=1 Tax=Herbaspirillum sp. GW103 TaxID=1175306 RepID=UPI0012F6C454|nr:hypothetical protein [Herbaspirillum sp. GW103]